MIHAAWRARPVAMSMTFYSLRGRLDQPSTRVATPAHVASTRLVAATSCARDNELETIVVLPFLSGHENALMVRFFPAR